MKASVLNNKDFVLQDVLKPVLKGKGAIVKVYGCGLCGSDIVKYTHDLVQNGAILKHLAEQNLCCLKH